MSSKADYTNEDWTLLLQVPANVATSVMSADISLMGILKELKAMGKAIEELSAAPAAQELVNALAADIKERKKNKHSVEAPEMQGGKEARLGAATYMVGRVGVDEFGVALHRSLAEAGVNTGAVFTDLAVSSGIAQIAVEESGQNHIIVVPESNGALDASDLARLEKLLPQAKLLLLQLEIPWDVTERALDLARKHDVQVLFDPASVIDLPREFYPLVDFITPNEVEAAQLVGFSVVSRKDAYRAADALLELGVGTAVVKLGAAGVVYASSAANLRGFVAPFPVAAVDTVAAGEAFIGGLAVALSEGQTLSTAVRWGATTGALATTKPGAQSAMPGREEVLRLL